jgi:hypothetical protein
MTVAREAQCIDARTVTVCFMRNETLREHFLKAMETSYIFLKLKLSALKFKMPLAMEARAAG